MKMLLVFCLVLPVFIGCEQDSGVAPSETQVEEPGPPVEEEPPALTGISIVSLPQTLYYALGQEFDSGGLVVEGTFSNGESRTLEPEEYRLTVLPPDMELPGPKLVEVRTGEFAARTAVIVNNSDSVLDSISVSQAADNVHRLGEGFRQSALNVVGTFRDKDGNTEKKNLSVFSVQGYDREKRGEQTVTVSVNGKTETAPVVVRVPPDAVVLGAFMVGSDPTAGLVTPDGSIRVYGHNTAFIKGQPLALSNAKFKVWLSVDGARYTLLSGDGIDPDEIDFDTSIAGTRKLSFNLDDKKIDMDVYVTDIEPEAYFDYGFWRHEDMEQPDAYHTVPGNAVVLAPARVLIGYDRDNQDIGAEYEWTVSPATGAAAAYSANNEFLTLSPSTTGRWEISVKVTGRNFVDGKTVSRTASTAVVCDQAKDSDGMTSVATYRYHPTPGQFTEGGTGHGWSLGTIGGYVIAKAPHADVYTAKGNAFGDWVEPGIVWFQEDLNGNGEPDEVWYEAYIGPSTTAAPITRRYSITFFKSDESNVKPPANTWGQICRDIYWADCKGRTGLISGGWPREWGAPNYRGAKVTYTCTLASDNDVISTGNREDFNLPKDVPFADYYFEEFPISMAAAADGSPVSLTNVRFVKIHTGVFKINVGAFGEISTEADVGVLRK
jgi:hypothetical protein